MQYYYCPQVLAYKSQWELFWKERHSRYGGTFHLTLARATSPF